MFEKITDNVEIHQTLPDTPNMTTQELKITWDKGCKIIKEAFNKLVDKLNEAKITSTVLYENSTGETGDITLSETAANFKKLEVQYNYNGICSSNTIENPNGKKMSLSVGFSVTQYNVARYQYRVISISETNITTDTAGYLSCSETGISGVSSTENKIYITKVVGYK